MFKNVLLCTGVLVMACQLQAEPPANNEGRPQGGPPWVRARMLFQTFDANRDEALSADEVPAQAWDRLSAADGDEDGQVTQAEVAAYSVTMLFGAFDTNSDNALTADEAPAKMWERMSAADADGDGAVTSAELIEKILSHPRQGQP